MDGPDRATNKHVQKIFNVQLRLTLTLPRNALGVGTPRFLLQSAGQLAVTAKHSRCHGGVAAVVLRRKRASHANESKAAERVAEVRRAVKRRATRVVSERHGTAALREEERHLRLAVQGREVKRSALMLRRHRIHVRT